MKTMKNTIARAIVMAFIILAIMTPARAYAKSCKTDQAAKAEINKYIKQNYTSKKKYKGWKVKFVSENKLTNKMLTSRKRKHIIYVEVIDGTQLDDNGFKGITSYGADMRYRGYIKANKGDQIRTYCIYSAKDNSIDNVVKRFDTKNNIERIRTMAGVITDAGETYKFITVDDNQIWEAEFKGNYEIGDLIRVKISDKGTPNNFKDDEVIGEPEYLGYVDGESDLRNPNKLYAFWIGNGYWERSDGIHWKYWKCEEF